MMKGTLILSVLLGVLCSLVLAAPSCKFKDEESGKKFDLTKLTQDGEFETSPYTNPEGDTYVYRFGICTNITTPCDEETPVDAACTQFQQGDCVAYTGRYNGNSETKVLDPKDPSVGVQVIYNGGEDGSRGERQTVIKIYCGDESKDPKFINETRFDDHNPGDPGPGYIYTISMTSPEACPQKSGGGLSPGSILLIIFFCGVIPLYFIIGIPVEIFVYKTEGWKRFVPNANFWLDFPFLLKDGFMFPIQLIQGARSSSSYSTV